MLSVPVLAACLAVAGCQMILGSAGFSAYWSSWNVAGHGRFGWSNATDFEGMPGPQARILRVTFPAGSASPTVTRGTGAPVGGAQAYLVLPAEYDSLHLRYFVRFPAGFDFMKGGKLPGLYGGTVTGGQRIPDGTNGFSTRYMWRAGGAGEVYAYLPTSVGVGTSLGRGNWTFTPGVWHEVEQEVDLNTPGQSDGVIKVWFDHQQVLDQTGLEFRTVDTLKIQGLFFSTFFGGDDPSWATPVGTCVDFADFAVGPGSLGGT